MKDSKRLCSKKKKKKRLENNKIFNIINKKPRKKFAVQHLEQNVVAYHEAD